LADNTKHFADACLRLSRDIGDQTSLLCKWPSMCIRAPRIDTFAVKRIL
jgi:hypothetical protein